jgi:hypothetical protein
MSKPLAWFVSVSLALLLLLAPLVPLPAGPWLAGLPSPRLLLLLLLVVLQLLLLQGSGKH